MVACSLLAPGVAAFAQDLPRVEVRPAVEFGARTGQALSLPSDVAVSPDGRVYVVESGKHRVAVFDSAANPSGYVGEEGDGDGQLQGPVGIGVAPDGRVYVADRENKRLQVFSADGTFDRSIGLAEEADAVVPVDVAVSADGKTLFVTANNSHRVVAFDTKGDRRGGWGGDGNDAGQFKYPGSVSLDGAGRVVVADILNARVQVFDATGAPVAEFGEAGAKPGTFIRPKGVAVDRQGRIYVSDSYLGVVQVFSPDGELAGVLSVAGEPVRFEAPTGMDVSGGRLYVTDMLAGKVLAFDLEGAP